MTIPAHDCILIGPDGKCELCRRDQRITALETLYYRALDRLAELGEPRLLAPPPQKGQAGQAGQVRLSTLIGLVMLAAGFVGYIAKLDGLAGLLTGLAGLAGLAQLLVGFEGTGEPR